MTAPVGRLGVLAGLLALTVVAAKAAVLDGTPPFGDDNGLGQVRIDAGDNPAGAPGSAREPLDGNPLWAIPLKQLSATRERPIFSPSRRPPAPAVAAAPYVPRPAPPAPVVLQRPQLSLVGTVAGDAQGFGIFVEQSGDKVVRLKTGEVHQGWTLLEVRPRDIVLQKENQTVTLSLPAPVAASSGSGIASRDHDSQRDRR